MPHSNYRSAHLVTKIAGLTIAVLLTLGVSISSLPTVTHAENGKGGISNTPSTNGNIGSPTGQGVTNNNPTDQGETSNAGRLANPLKFNSLNELLDGLLAAAIELGSIILTLALIYTGFLFVAARGNEENISKARRALMFTIIGGLIILGAAAIKEVITSTVTSLRP